MIYQEECVFNDLSVLEINSNNKETTIKSFFDLCLKLILLSGKKKENADKSNFQYLRIYQDFYWEDFLAEGIGFYIKKLIENDDDKARLRKLLSTAEIDSVPEYQHRSRECRALGYACEKNLLSISLMTSEEWNTSKIEIKKIILNESLTEIPVQVRNITSIDNTFEVLGEFAESFYENCHSENIYYTPNPKDKTDKNFTHNLLPLKDISNQYLEYKDFYSTKLDVTPTKKVAKIVAALNGWIPCSEKSRVIYKHQTTKSFYLSNDTKKADFEIHDSKGDHLGAISFDCKKQEGLKSGRKITPC